MKAIIVLLMALFLIGEYSIGEYLVDPPLRYTGMGRDGSPIALYDPSTDNYLYIPLTNRSRFIFEFNGFLYEIVSTQFMRIQVYRRD